MASGAISFPLKTDNWTYADMAELEAATKWVDDRYNISLFPQLEEGTDVAALANVVGHLWRTCRRKPGVVMCYKMTGEIRQGGIR